MAKGALIAAVDFSPVSAGCCPRAVSAPAAPNYLALYHLASPGVVDTSEWKDASGSTPMPQHVRDQISNRLRLVCRNYVRA